MSPKRHHLLCNICGDKSIGRSFGAITCESCKVFFRRNVLKFKEFECIHGDYCNITVKSRRKCKKCRFYKCIQMGMKTQLVQSKSSENNTIDDYESVLSNESLVNYDFNQSYDNNKVISRHEFMFDPVFKQLTDYQTFNELESIRLSELQNALQVFTYMSLYTHNNIEVTNIYKLYEYFCRKLEKDTQNVVSFANNLESFNKNCFNDRLALIKFGFLEILILRYAIRYNTETNVWTGNLDNDDSFVHSLEVLKYEERNMYNIYKDYYHKLIPESQCDSLIMDLLSAILLLNPKRPYLIHRDVIKSEQQLYIYLLQRYLLNRYPSESESQIKLQNLMNTLIDIQVLNEIEKRNGIERYLQYFGPISKEMLFN
ncbi:nuclear hormone receptor HR96-like [Oppia nitens]|uniref:nuclear hormone receptor HR96-like n=1 Tax=Oppia nitens TaxID=1686743 RepID=UPI0023DB6FFE|nr:nuclear hormone receptor HR96-like [Oppia nitens]